MSARQDTARVYKRKMVEPKMLRLQSKQIRNNAAGIKGESQSVRQSRKDGSSSFLGSPK